MSRKSFRPDRAFMLDTVADHNQELWRALWKGLCTGREGFGELPVAQQNRVIGSLAKLGLSTGNIVRVLRTTKGLVLARARDYPRVIALQGRTDRHRAMNRYLHSLPRPR